MPSRRRLGRVGDSEARPAPVGQSISERSKPASITRVPVENRWSHQVPSFGNPAGGTKLERQSGSDLPISGAGRGARLELWVTRIKADAQIANPARSFRSGEPCWPADSSNRSSAEGRGRPGDATVQGGVAHRADFPASAVGAGATAAQLGTTVSRCGLSIDSTHCPSRSCSSANRSASRVRRQPTQLGSRRHACGRCLSRVACSSFPAGDMPTARRTNVMTCRITPAKLPG
jgi:hypothetical protein